MNLHRLHTLDIPANPKPIPQVPLRADPPDNGYGVMFGLTALFTVVLGAYTIATLGEKPQATAEPVRSPVMQVQELPPLTVYEASIVSWRAGFAAGLEQGCSAPALSHPIHGE